jgi:hypothetical protein
MLHIASLVRKKSESLILVPGVGIEPTSLARHDFKSCAYTSSAIRAWRPGAELNRRIGVLQTPALPLGYQAIS